MSPSRSSNGRKKLNHCPLPGEQGPAPSNLELVTDFSEALEPDPDSRCGPNGRWMRAPSLTTDESADGLLENDELKDCLDKHLSALPDTQRSALMLYGPPQDDASASGANGGASPDKTL